MFFAAECGSAVAPAAGGYHDPDFVNKHLALEDTG
jgi:hypothetical protein